MDEARERALDALGSVEEDEVLLDPVLAGELVQAPRAHRRLERELVVADLGRGDALDGHDELPPGESNM